MGCAQENVAGCFCAKAPSNLQPKTYKYPVFNQVYSHKLNQRHSFRHNPRHENQLDEITDQVILVFCVTKLEAQRREVFQTYYWSGLKMKEIALVMDLNISVIKNHMTRGVGSFGIAFRKMVCIRGCPNQKCS